MNKIICGVDVSKDWLDAHLWPGDLIVMMIAASLCGATNATEFSLFAQERKQALSRLIEYEEAPSHDTFSRLLRPPKTAPSSAWRCRCC